MTKLGIVFVAIAALGCGKSDKGGKGGSSSGGGPAATGTGIAVDAAAVNSLVPAELKDKLVFEKTDIVIERGKDKTTYTMAVPKGWHSASKMFANLEPPSDAGVGMLSKLSVGSNCDGRCEPKDWEQVADKVNFIPLASGKILKDAKADGSRTMISEAEDRTIVVHTWWTKGASKYHACTATLDGAIRAAAPAFEKACQAISIVGDD